MCRVVTPILFFGLIRVVGLLSLDVGESRRELQRIRRQHVGLLCSDGEILLEFPMSKWVRSAGTAVLFLCRLLLHIFVTICITLYTRAAATALR